MGDLGVGVVTATEHPTQDMCKGPAPESTTVGLHQRKASTSEFDKCIALHEPKQTRRIPGAHPLISKIYAQLPTATALPWLRWLVPILAVGGPGWPGPRSALVGLLALVVNMVLSIRALGSKKRKAVTIDPNPQVLGQKVLESA